MNSSRGAPFIHLAVFALAIGFSLPAAAELQERDHHGILQVGAFTDTSRAVALANRLREMGFAAHVMPAPDFHRVLVGSLCNPASAETTRLELESRGYQVFFRVDALAQSIPDDCPPEMDLAASIPLDSGVGVPPTDSRKISVLPAALSAEPASETGVRASPRQETGVASPPVGGNAEDTSGSRPLEEVEALRVFLDCDDGCDLDHIRTEITFVNYVRDRRDAQVHVLVTRQPAGGGTEFTFAFIGLETFAGRNDEIRYMSSSTDMEDERREGITQTLQLGLLPYLGGTPLASQVRIRHDPARDLGAAQPEDDPWNFWVFRSSADVSLSGESSETERSLSGSFTASRTTEQWNTRLGLNGSYDRTDFDLGDGTTFVSTFRDVEVTALVVKSRGDHWGLGIVGSAISSSFLNQDLTLRVAPAVEYNLFPYPEWTRRRLTLTYAVGVNALDYEEATIFDKLREVLFDHTFRLSFDTTQPWGESSVAVEMSHFLNDPSKNRVTSSASLDFRIVRGLSLNVWANVSRIRDQVFLSGADLSVEDRLVRRRQLATDFFYGMGIGVSYRFGSIYNNVVNSRFAGGSRGFIKRF